MKQIHLFFTVLAIMALLIIPVSAGYLEDALAIPGKVEDKLWPDGYDITGINLKSAQIIQPGYVTSFSYTCDPDEKISVVGYDIPLNTQVNFTLTYGTGATVDGWMIYRPVGIAGQAYSEISIGGNTYSETFIDPQIAGYSVIKHVEFVSYARNKTGDEIVETGFAVFQEGYIVHLNNEIAFYPVEDITHNLIYKIQVFATQDTNVIVRTNKAEDLVKYVKSTLLESTADIIAEKVNELIGFISSVLGIIYTIISWLKFIFIDNIVITFVFFFLGTLAYYINTSKDIFQFYQRFFRAQKTFIEFIINIFDRAWRWITRT